MLTKKVRIIFIISMMFFIYACSREASVTEWQHGFKTENITATRLNNKSGLFQFAIMLNFSNRYDYLADRTDVLNFMESQGCTEIEGGGMPHSNYLYFCDKALNKEQANNFIPMLLPKLDKFMSGLQ